MNGAGEPIVARLAPSPTGLLHVGHARSFLIAWWHARQRGGRVLLRLEDLDTERVREGMVEACLEDLHWLGLDWDGEPRLQSEHTAAMGAAVERLLADGRAYPCVCSRREIREALSAPHPSAHSGGELLYPGTCRDRFATVEEAERATGHSAGIRFRIPDHESDGAPDNTTRHWLDELHGAMETNLAHIGGDFLIGRRGGSFAYQLAVVVDDAQTGVTEVLRGDDLLESTPRQLLLQEALDLPHPTWIHVPLVLDENGERLAKRTGGTTIAGLREAGVDPLRLVSWVARSCGLDVESRVSAGDVLPSFSLARLARTPVRFGTSELEALLRP